MITNVKVSRLDNDDMYNYFWCLQMLEILIYQRNPEEVGDNVDFLLARSVSEQSEFLK